MGNTIDSRPVFSQEASPCSRPSTPVSSLLYQAKFSSEMLARVVRILLRYDPQAVCRFLCSSRFLQQLVREGSDETAELNAARSLLTQQRLHELRVAAGFEGGILALAQSFSQQFSIAQRVEKELKAAGLVQSPGPTTVLDLRNRGRRWRVDGEARGQAVARFLRVSTVLKQLNVGDNKIGVDGAKAIGEALRVNTVLKELRLHNNSIGDEGAAAVADALRGNGALTRLDLYDNFIGTEGAKAIGGGLQINGTLKKLFLERNNIGDEGAGAMADALRLNGSLKELHLRANKIGADGAQALGEALPSNHALAALNVQLNGLNQDSASKLRKAVQGRHHFNLYL